MGAVNKIAEWSTKIVLWAIDMGMMIENKTEIAERWLQEYMCSHHEAFVQDINSAARDAGFDPPMISKVCRCMAGITRHRMGYGRGGKWFWRLDYRK